MTSNLSVAKPQKRTAKNADTPLGRVIAAARSQKALAAKLGVTKGAVSQWATGRYELPVKQVLAIVNAYGDVVTCAELRPDVDWPTDPPRVDPEPSPLRDGASSPPPRRHSLPPTLSGAAICAVAGLF